MKMILPHRMSTFCSIILILLLQTSLHAKTTNRCPIGFQISYTKDDKTPICYRLKGPERFADAFKNCTGNLYTAKLYDNLMMSNRTELVLWTEYRSAYVGGPFVDWSGTSTTGSLLETSFNVSNPHLGIEEVLCVAKDPVGNYTAERCDKMYYRYCFVEPYATPTSSEGCEKFKGGIRFYSPKPMCLFVIPGVLSTGVRATWTQSHDLCDKKHGQILYNGWRYSNNPRFHLSTHPREYPLRVTYDPIRNITFPSVAENLQWHCGGWKPYKIPKRWIETHPCTYDSEHEKKIFVDTVKAKRLNVFPTDKNETQYGIIRNDVWETTNSSHVFYDLICEKDVILKKLTLVVKADTENKLVLVPSENVAVHNLLCFTDSVTYYPTPVNISYDGRSHTYVLSPSYDGNYWCIYKDTKRFIALKSNEFLWIREEEELKHKYAVKIKLEEEYTLDNINDSIKIWEKKLKDYIYYSTEYKNSVGIDDLDTVDLKDYQRTLEQFKKEHPELKSRKEKILFEMKLKQLYLDRKTALLHVKLDPTMRAVLPGWWSNMMVVIMQPVRFCSRGKELFVDILHLDCEQYKCTGNFNLGFTVVTESDDICKSGRVSLATNVTIRTTESYRKLNETFPTARSSSSSEDSDDDSYDEPTEAPRTTTDFPIPPDDPIITVEPSFPSTTETIPTTELPTTTEIPTTTELPTTTWRPDEQLQQVMDDLELLLLNDTVPLNNITQPFIQVDQLLENNMTLEIPGRLLRLLDQIGKNLKLNGTNYAREVRRNVALLVADSNPSFPVNGLRIATRYNDSFTEEAFEIMNDVLNPDKLNTDASEAVVQLPTSVANSSRRISFVIFRNDRAFQSNVTNMSVNSRILSINVEDTVKFENGEVINIYFRPLSEAARDQGRSCGYWKFDDESAGHWSQEGCTFIEATEPGMMDACQCTHLTHFAEILVPRTVFSELDEMILEILSVIGCCLSIFGLTVVAITAILFRSWRTDFNNKIWLQLCLAVLLLVICFLITVFVKFRTYTLGCMFLGVIIHYSVLASFSWMLVAAVISYKRLVKVFNRDASHKLLRAAAFAWGAPIAIVGILLASAPNSYQGQFDDINSTSSFCYPSGLGLWLAVYAPIAIMLLANWTLFILILRSVFGNKTIGRYGGAKEAKRCATVSCLLTFLFGLPWIFGLFAQNVVASYFFAIMATFQGFILFIFFVVGNKKTRDLWLNKLKIRQSLRVPVTTSTYTNRSTGVSAPGWRGNTVEGKISKPRSLSNSDNSRFS